MSGRIENWADIKELALMSVGTDKGAWWAYPEFGSELWLLRREGKMDGNTAGTLERLLRECLAWLVQDGLCENVDARAERVGKRVIAYTVTLYKPGGGNAEIKGVWNAV
jgi:phage gp46-like protein